MARCPNCHATVAWDDLNCATCSATFDGEQAWRPIPESPEERSLLTLKYPKRPEYGLPRAQGVIVLPVVIALVAVILAPLLWGLTAGLGFPIAAAILFVFGWPYFAGAGFLFGLVASLIPEEKLKRIAQDAPMQIVLAVGLGVISASISAAAYVKVKNEWRSDELVLMAALIGAACGPILWIVAKKLRL